MTGDAAPVVPAPLTAGSNPGESSRLQAPPSAWAAVGVAASVAFVTAGWRPPVWAGSVPRLGLAGLPLAAAPLLAATLTRDGRARPEVARRALPADTTRNLRALGYLDRT
jgi:hypothetical protein